MLIFLSYALLSVLLTPVILRQKVIPAVSMRTGAHVAVKDMAWNPFTLTIHLKEMVIGSSADTPLFSVEQLDLDLGLLRSIIHRAVAVDSLTLFNPGLDIHPGTEGNTNLADFLREIESRSPETPSEEGESPLRIAISQLTLKSGQIQMAAHSNGLPSLIQSLDLDLHGLQTFGSSEAEFVVSLKMDDQAQFSAKGTFSLDGSDSDFSAEAHDLNLAQLQSQIPKILDLPIMEGVLDFSSHFKAKLGPHIQIQMQHLDAALHDVRLSRPEYEQPLLSFKRFSVEEGMLDFAEHRMHFNALDLESPGVTRAKDQNGQPRWLGLMPAKASSIPSSTDPADASQSGKPWLIDIDQLMFHEIHLLPTPAVSAAEQPDVRLGLFEGEEIHLDMANRLLVAKALRLKHSRLLFGLDHDAILPMDGLIPQSGLSSPSVSEEPSAPSPWAIRIMKTELSDLALGVIRVSTPYSAPFELSNLEASLGAIDTNSPQEAPLNLTSNVSSGGKLEVDGKLNLAAKTFHGDVTIDKVGLNPLKSLLSESYRLDAVEGVLSSQVNITASLQSDGLQGDYTGVVGVDGLRLTQSPGDRKLLGWRSLDVQGIKGHLNPFQFSANEIRLQNPDGVIAIHEDKSSNLSDLRVTPPDRPGNKLPRPSSSTTKSSEPDIHIRRIRVEGGKLDYTDESLVLPFSTQIVDLKGAISGWTLDPNGKSLLELNGRIAPYGEAAIHGQLRPRDPKSSLDVDLHFENVVLASLTPYSATFAGRELPMVSWTSMRTTNSKTNNSRAITGSF